MDTCGDFLFPSERGWDIQALPLAEAARGVRAPALRRADTGVAALVSASALDALLWPWLLPLPWFLLAEVVVEAAAAAAISVVTCGDAN